MLILNFCLSIYTHPEIQIQIQQKIMLLRNNLCVQTFNILEINLLTFSGKKREGQKLIVVLSAPKHFLEQTTWKIMKDYILDLNPINVSTVKKPLLRRQLYRIMWGSTLVRNLLIVYSVQSRFLQQVRCKDILLFIPVRNFTSVFIVRSHLLTIQV